MFIFRYPYSYIYYSAPGAPTGGSPPAPAQQPPSQPAQQGQPQPGAPGQGQQPQGFRQTFFPNVPDDQWGLIEPHISGVNRYVDQLHQTYAPLKGMSPQAIQGLAEFSQAFESNPVEQWFRIGNVLQEQGILDPDLDLEHFAALAAGENPDAGQQPALPQLPGQQGDPRDQVIQELKNEVQQLRQSYDQDKQSSRARVEDAALQRQLATIKKGLTDAGIPDGVYDDKQVLAMYIAHQGNANAVVEAATNARNAMLKGFVQDPNGQQQQQQQQQKDLDLPNGAPKAPGKRAGSSRRGFLAEAEVAAQQALAAAERQ